MERGYFFNFLCKVLFGASEGVERLNMVQEENF